MDARDIKEQVPEVVNKAYLEEIYNLQKGLLDHYVNIEGLPKYPIDVNTKKSQVLIKDFVGRVIEELGEGYESMLAIDELSTKNNLWCYDYSSEDYNLCISHLQNVSEEFADAMHFMTELLIYVNIQPEDILNYIESITNNDLNYIIKVMEINPKDIIQICMIYGVSKLMKDNDLDFSNSSQISLTDKEEFNVIDPELYKAGSNYNHNYYYEFKKCLWDVTYHLNIARNFLKNKPWKQSQMMTDEIRFQAEIVKAFITMMGAFYYIGLDSKTLFHIYFKKNRANAFRIRSNY